MSIYFFKSYLRERERERERVRVGRGIEGTSKQSWAGSTLNIEPIVGLNPTMLGVWPELKCRVGCPTKWATQAPCKVTLCGQVKSTGNKIGRGPCWINNHRVLHGRHSSILLLLLALLTFKTISTSSPSICPFYKWRKWGIEVLPTWPTLYSWILNPQWILGPMNTTGAH